jgi:hypothetical protein
MYSTLTPFHGLGDPDLAAALAAFSAIPPSRYAASGPLLNRAYAETVDGVISMINDFLIHLHNNGWLEEEILRAGSPSNHRHHLGTRWNSCVLEGLHIQTLSSTIDIVL